MRVTRNLDGAGMQHVKDQCPGGSIDGTRCVVSASLGFPSAWSSADTAVRVCI